MTAHIGPIDVILLEFPDQEPDGEVADELLKLVDAGTVRIFDILAVRKASDGSIEGFEATDLSADGLGSFATFAGARSGLIGDEDLAAAAEALEPGTVGVLIVYENTWAGPFASAVIRHGGAVVASERVSVLDVMEMLDELETAG